ncbi:MAG: CopD family protein [Polaromonas sp.]|nr:CopD family protein [Polaromonas sp.]
MLYLLLKSFHLAVVLTWVGGMLALAVMLAAQRAHGAPASGQPLLAAIYRWDRYITTPALGLVWVLGIALLVMGGWYSAPWLWAKFGIVFVLSGIHGNQSASLRRLLAGQVAQLPASVRWVPGLTLAAITAVALLVILKPWSAG